VHLRLASRLQRPAPAGILATRGHSLSVTCAVTSSRSDSLYTASKDGSIVRWSLRDGHMVARTLPRSRATTGEDAAAAPAPRASSSRKSGAARRAARARGANAVPSSVVGEAEGHTDEVWSLALTDDASLLASGGPDRRVALWSLEPITASTSLALRREERAASSPAPRWLSGLGGHKDAVTALAFQMGSSQLLSASNDRTLKLWDGTQRSYIETLFGHQEPALSVSVLRGEVAASAGGRDRTVRWWKIRDESQLVFRAGARSRVREVIEGGSWEKADKDEGEQIVEGSVECVAMVDEHCFISGGDSG
jgi:ribosomal RNA-processing protein 9